MNILGIRRRAQRGLWVFMIPMALNDWSAVSIPSRPFPEVKERAGTWQIATRGAAGGYAYFFDQPLSFESGNSALSWEWSVSKFPSAHPIAPFKKADDDYAIRVGALFSDGENEIPVPKDFQKILKERKLRIAYAVFYGATPAGLSKSQAGVQCSVSPYSDRGVNCHLPAAAEMRSVIVHPFADAIRNFQIPSEKRKNLKLVGLWVFADSDNSDSESAGKLAGLSLTEMPGYW